MTRTPRQQERLAGGHGLMLPLPLDASRSLPDFVELDLQGKVLPEGVGPGDVKAFQVLYREHCEVGQSDGGWVGAPALNAAGFLTGSPMLALPHSPL